MVTLILDSSVIIGETSNDGTITVVLFDVRLNDALRK